MEDHRLRVAIVTGADGAVGQAVALELARYGWSLFLQCDRSAGDLEDAIGGIRKAASKTTASVEVRSARVDLTRQDGREQLVEQVLEEFGRMNMLVNAATHYPNGAEDLLEMTQGAFEAVINHTLTATVFLTQLVANEMVRLVESGEIESPRIVTINSISAYTSSVDHGPHCIGKAGLAMMTQLFADRLGQYGINVYEVRAGILATGSNDPARAKYEELIEQGLTPLRRWGRTQDLARAVAAVASGLLDFSTGEVLNVDGGFHLRRL